MNKLYEQKQDNQAPQSAGGNRGTIAFRWRWPAVGLLVLAIATGIALVQDPWPDPYQPKQTLWDKSAIPLRQTPFFAFPWWMNRSTRPISSRVRKEGWVVEGNLTPQVNDRDKFFKMIGQVKSS